MKRETIKSSSDGKFDYKLVHVIPGGGGSDYLECVVCVDGRTYNIGTVSFEMPSLPLATALALIRAFIYGYRKGEV